MSGERATRRCRGLLWQAGGDWQQRLDAVVATMREISSQTDPQAMVRDYARRMREVLPVDRSISLSRRDLEEPYFRVTRYSGWSEEPDPWAQPDRLPLLKGGLLGELLYGDEPRMIQDLKVASDDPAAEYLEGQRSLFAIPLYDKGKALNMVVMTKAEPGGFDHDVLPEWVWMSNLFGRATHNLVLTEELQRAYKAVDSELEVVADIQRSLLPPRLPKIKTLDLAAYYQTSHRAGGDYYDVFPLPNGRWGILIADVSGHGTPAAVVMAIMHSIVHTYPGPPEPPGAVLAYVNQQLAVRYTSNSGAFVTAFYGVYNPCDRSLTFANAGHPPPRLKRCEDGSVHSVNGNSGLPLGILFDEVYPESMQTFVPGDQVVLFTDGITEASSLGAELFGLEQLDKAIYACGLTASGLIQSVLTAVEEFTGGQPPDDDRTMIIGKVS